MVVVKVEKGWWKEVVIERVKMVKKRVKKMEG